MKTGSIFQDAEDTALQAALELIYDRLPEETDYLTLKGGHQIIGKVAIIGAAAISSPENYHLNLGSDFNRFALCPLCGKETESQHSQTADSQTSGDQNSAHPTPAEKERSVPQVEESVTAG